MIEKIVVFHCPRCASANVVKNGKNSAGYQQSYIHSTNAAKQRKNRYCLPIVNDKVCVELLAYIISRVTH